MAKPKETLEKAYGNIPREPIFKMDLDWLPTPRGIKYYWLLIIRKFKR